MIFLNENPSQTIAPRVKAPMPAEDFLSDLPFFSGLPKVDMAALLQAGFMRKCHKHQNLFQQGDTANSFFIIVSGWIKAHRETVDGDEAVLAIFTRGDVFGEAAMFTGAGYPYAAEAAEDTSLIEIPCGVLRTCAQGNPDIMMRVVLSMSREVRSLQIENEHMVLMTAPQRVGCLLLQLSSGVAGGSCTFSFPYDKSLAASRLGMKPETFSRALAQLKPLGVHVSGAKIDIMDFSKLTEYCCSQCSAEFGECRCVQTAGLSASTHCFAKRANSNLSS
jgi:CRP-like cAMP-binding protein